MAVGDDSPMEDRFDKVAASIDAAHAEDPNTVVENGEKVPYEVHYSNKMIRYLKLRAPDASPILCLAIRAQHLRRWEVPRDAYPMTKAGYYSWRTFLKERQATIASQLCAEGGLSDGEIQRVAQLVRKEDLKVDSETKILEDVACLVFLDDQLDAFEEKHDDEKIISILRKTWAKMTEQGHELALQLPMNKKCQELISMALNG